MSQLTMLRCPRDISTQMRRISYILSLAREKEITLQDVTVEALQEYLTKNKDLLDKGSVIKM